jgi:hypothetical protein
MSQLLIIEGGLFLGMIVALIDATIALALTVFLVSRWRILNNTMRAYTIFWGLTFLTWFPQAIKYFIFSVGGDWDTAWYFDIGLQVAVYASGPALFYYAGSRLNIAEKKLLIVTIISAIAGLISIWLMTLPAGLAPEPRTYFSVETKPSFIPLLIFNIEIVSIFALMAVDVYQKVKQYRLGLLAAPYEIYFTLAVCFYLVLGAIDQAAIATNWALIGIRALYALPFVLVYVIMSEQQATSDQYLLWGQNSRSG